MIPMRIGIMGGTLDPVHNGHLAVARAVREALGLDGAMLLPAGDPPHKRRRADKADRWEMARLAAAGMDGMSASDIEILRDGTTYTVDTLEQLSSAQPGVEWVYIIGADTVNVLETWRRFARVAELCAFAAVGRPGCDSGRTHAHAAQLAQAFGARIQFLDVDGPAISSTEIRNRVAENRPIDGLVPAAVAEYIREKGLYLCGMTWAEIDAELSRTLKPSRYRHSLGVAETAMRLAPRYGVDPQRARLAGLLHDCAKSMSPEETAALVRANVPDADVLEMAASQVLHAPAGMVVARQKFGVRDPEILSAIRKHTLGGPDMTPLEALIYVADVVEPNRTPYDGLARARELAETDLCAAAKYCAQMTKDYVEKNGRGTVHPRTAAMLRGRPNGFGGY